MGSKPEFSVAIVGGGLCGLALAIALEKRNVSYTLYEARSSFTEIGAGLSLAPNGIHAFNAIDSNLYEEIHALATRNAKEDVWMALRLGAPTDSFEDGHLICDLHAPPSGNMTVSRNELLQLLARSIPTDRPRFNKKVIRLDHSKAGTVTLEFADGTTAAATVAIGCDGIHSTIRTQVIDSADPARNPKYSETGGYRAVFSMKAHEQVVGADKAHMSTIWCGEHGYVVMYPINGGDNVNIGLWMKKKGPWEADSWVLHDQKPQMLEDFKDWGATIQKVMSKMSDYTEFWAAFHHADRPEHYFYDRVCLIGDSAHSMPPHQGQGASQAMVDACVMADVLERLKELEDSSDQNVEKAFLGFEAARKERFERVARTSAEAHDFWASIWRPGLTAEELEKFQNDAYKRFRWIWDVDVAGQQQAALTEMNRLLKCELKG